MQPRTCPHCDTIIPPDSGFFFDGNNNLVCENCNKIIIKVYDPEIEKKNKEDARKEREEKAKTLNTTTVNVTTEVNKPVKEGLLPPLNSYPPHLNLDFETGARVFTGEDIIPDMLP